MKNLFRLFTLLIVLVVAFVLVSPAFAQDGSPPNALTIQQFDLLAQGVIAVITFLVVAGVKGAAKEWGVDITGKSTQITAVLVTAAFEAINYMFTTIPPEYSGIATGILSSLTVLFSAFGVNTLIKQWLTIAAIQKKIVQLPASPPAHVPTPAKK